jgi:hypothetical protein
VPAPPAPRPIPQGHFCAGKSLVQQCFRACKYQDCFRDPQSSARAPISAMFVGTGDTAGDEIVNAMHPKGNPQGSRGNAIESAEIDGRRSRRPLAGKLSPGDFRLLQQNRPDPEGRPPARRVRLLRQTCRADEVSGTAHFDPQRSSGEVMSCKPQSYNFVAPLLRLIPPSHGCPPSPFWSRGPLEMSLRLP